MGQCKFRHFMDLPSEIRDRIYDFAMAGERYGSGMDKIGRYGIPARVFEDPVELREFYRYRPYSGTIVACFLPAVCRVSRAMQRETINRFISNSTFFVCSYPENRIIQSWLEIVPNGLASVRSLHFQFFGRFPGVTPQNADLELAAHCPGLIEIKMALHTNDLRISGPPDGNGVVPYLPRPVEAIWSFYMLDRLLSCTSLERVQILRKGYSCSAAATAALNLAGMIEQQFLERSGRTVVVQVIGP